jgi:hypothetical protein
MPCPSFAPSLYTYSLLPHLSISGGFLQSALALFSSNCAGLSFEQRSASRLSS